MSGIVTVRSRYSVFFTPRKDTLVYDEEIDVSDYILFQGIGKITKSIDSTDYNVGIFVFSDLELKGQNYNGYFNDETDGRSIFKFSRDLAKVRVVYTNPDTGDVIQFRGLLNEAATQLNTTNSQITFKILSLDSVLRNTNIPAGAVSDGMTVKQAMSAILTQAAITTILNVDTANINPTLNFTIDIGSALDNVSVQDGLNQLLVASNSCMLIDPLENVIIKQRVMAETKPILNLYGPYDIYGRQNTIALDSFNSGKQRMFNSFMINDIERQNSAAAKFYGFNQYQDTFSFINDEGTLAGIAQELVNEFSYPKLECQIEIPVAIAPNIQILDAISLNWPLLIKPWPNSFLPIVGITKIGDTNMPLPVRYGPLEIPPNVAWKVISITDDPQKFIKTLKLRQAGVNISDGYFTVPGSSRVGFAIIGDGAIGGTGTTSYNPSIVGAAQVGNTMIA